MNPLLGSDYLARAAHQIQRNIVPTESPIHCGKIVLRNRPMEEPHRSGLWGGAQRLIKSLINTTKDTLIALITGNSRSFGSSVPGTGLR